MRRCVATITATAWAATAGASVVIHSGLTLVDTPSAVRQVSFDGQNLCAVTALQSVICHFNAVTVSQWKTVYASHAAWINVAGDSLWAMDEWSTPLHSATNDTSSWTYANYTLATAFISDRRAICQLAFNKIVYCAPESGGNIEEWLAITPSPSTRSLDVWQSTVVGIDSKGAVYTAQWPAQRLATASPISLSPGPYRSIATDGAFTCATKDTTETIFCYHNTTGDWQPIAAKFTQIALRDARLYGVSSNGTLWTTTLKLESDERANLAALKMAERDAEASIIAEYTREIYMSKPQRVETPTPIERVSFDGSHVCVTVKSQAAMCAGFKPNERLHWSSLEKDLKSVAVAGDIVWGVSRDNKVLWRPTNLTTPWTRTAATWSSVASDGKVLCGINAEEVDRQTLRCSLRGTPTGSDDLYDLVTLEEVGVAPNGTIYGITTDKTIYDYTPSDFPGATERLRSIASDGKIRCTSSETSSTITCISRKSNRVAAMNADLAHLVMNSGRLFGIASNGTLWTMRVVLKAKGESSADIDDEPSDSKDAKFIPAAASSGRISGYIVAAVVGGIALLGAVAFFVYRSRRQARSKKAAMTDSQPTNGDSDQVDDVTPSSSADAFYRSTSKSPAAKTNQLEPQQPASNLGDWMNDPALRPWRIPRRQLAFDAIISRGAFGEVYRGRYDDTDVAIKVLAPDRRRLMHEIEDFAKEALFLTALEHDRIVRLIGVAWTAPSDLCIVSELMNGGDVLDLLRQYQREGHPQGFTKFKATIALHVAEALVYLHSQSPKLLHRDLKSKNIMLTETGDAKLTDFGVARTWEDLTLTAGVGSLLWMAPEVVFGDRYDEKADIYSFGVVLSELDTHELPYSHASVESTASSGERLPELAICQLVAAGELSIDFSDRCLPELRALGLSCVAVEPKMRPSASRVLRRLKEVVGQLLAESEVESSKDGSSAKDSQHDDEDADANTQTVVGRVTVPQARYSNLGDWMNDPALRPWRIPRRQLAFDAIISRGAFGEVYRGRYDDTDVAIKVLAPDRRRLMHEIEDFAKEALFLTALEHDRIVRLIGVAWTAPSDLCIVSELMNGGDVLDLLRQYQREGHPQGFTKFKATIALHVAEALVYLHSQSPKLLHRDLKSKNIMLTETGDAKLTDFGVARTWEDLTLTAGVGSLLWMAPEVVFGDRYDEKADIYSFGVVLSELDTHELPFSGDARLPELAICQLVAAGEMCVKFSERTLPELRALGLSCMALDQSKRPSASDVLMAMRNILERLHV